MKNKRIWIMVASMILIMTGIALTFALQQTEIWKTGGDEVGHKRRFNQFPPNTTVLPPPGRLLFELSLSDSRIMISRGESLSISVIVYGRGEANLSLAVGVDDIPEIAVLPTGIDAVLDRTSLMTETKSTTTVNLTISIRNEAIPGTYKLVITGTQRTNWWVLASGVPLEITVS